MLNPNNEKAFWDEAGIVFDTLFSDLLAIDEQLERQDQQTWRRAYCRALFALIESQISYLKNHVLAFPDGGIDEEIELPLRDMRKGKKNQTINSFKSFQENVILAFETFAWYYGIEYQVDKEDNGWEALISSSRVRNRVVHPKTLADLSISDDEMDNLKIAGQWFFQQMTHLHRKHLKRLLTGLRNVKRWLKNQPTQNSARDSDDPAL